MVLVLFCVHWVLLTSTSLKIFLIAQMHCLLIIETIIMYSARINDSSIVRLHFNSVIVSFCNEIMFWLSIKNKRECIKHRILTIPQLATNVLLLMIHWLIKAAKLKRFKKTSEKFVLNCDKPIKLYLFFLNLT